LLVVAVIFFSLLMAGCENGTMEMGKHQDKKVIAWPPPGCDEVQAVYSPELPATTPYDFSLIPGEEFFYHIFHINGSWFPYQPPSPAARIPRKGRDLGHATTANFTSWTQKNNIQLRYFGEDDDGWSSEHIWAPHVYKHDDGIYYMFYTGVDYEDLGTNDDTSSIADVAPFHYEAIGLAKSNNLVDWEYYDADGDSTGKLLDPSGVSWVSWGDHSIEWPNDCRDPFVWHGLGTPQMGMLVSVKLFPENRMSIAFLTASAPESTWSWQWPIDITTTKHAGHGAESACMTYKNGTFYLFWTEPCHTGTHFAKTGGYILHVATATSFGRDGFSELAVKNLFGFANEVTISNTGDVIFSSVEDGKIKFGVFDFVDHSIKPLTNCNF